jgi:uncharacterized membrane protein
MLVVRYLALTALVVWLGGMIALGLLVAPTTFRVLEAADPEQGRTLAGAVFGATLRRFHLLAYGCGAVLLVSLFLMKFVGPPPQAFLVRTSIVALMLALTLYSGVPVTRELERLQAAVAGPMARLPQDDPRRVRFDRLHRTSTTLMTVDIGLGLLLLAWYVRE